MNTNYSSRRALIISLLTLLFCYLTSQVNGSSISKTWKILHPNIASVQIVEKGDFKESPIVTSIRVSSLNDTAKTSEIVVAFATQETEESETTSSFVFKTPLSSFCRDDKQADCIEVSMKEDQVLLNERGAADGILVDLRRQQVLSKQSLSNVAKQDFKDIGIQNSIFSPFSIS